jgi:hypothetical protein
MSNRLLRPAALLASAGAITRWHACGGGSPATEGYTPWTTGSRC